MTHYLDSETVLRFPLLTSGIYEMKSICQNTNYNLPNKKTYKKRYDHLKYIKNKELESGVTTLIIDEDHRIDTVLLGLLEE